MQKQKFFQMCGHIIVIGIQLHSNNGLLIRLLYAVFLFAVDICKKCDINAKCINETCICVEGFYGDGFTCHSKID